MPHRPILAGLLTAIVALAAGCLDLGEVSCTDDDQCRYGRICSPAGLCVASTPPLHPTPDAGPGSDTDARPPAEPQPRLIASPAELTFDRIDNSDPTWRRAWRETTIRNTGNAVADLDSIDFSGDPSFELDTPEEGWPDTLAPGESFTLRVWYHTQSSEPVSGTVLVHSSDLAARFEVPVWADPNPPCVEVEPERNLFFRPQEPNQQIVKDVVVTNCAEESNLALRDVRLEIDAGGGFYVPTDELPERLPEHSALIAPGESVALPVVYTGRSFEWNEGELVIETNVPNQRIIRIGLLRETDANDCPIARAGVRLADDDESVPFVRSLRVPVGSRVMLNGEDSVDADGRVVRYEWTAVEWAGERRPGGLPETGSFLMQADTPGRYLIELDVWDDDGASSCGGVARVTIIAE